MDTLPEHDARPLSPGSTSAVGPSARRPGSSQRQGCPFFSDRSHAPAWERCFDAPASPGRPPRESSSRRPARPSLRQAPHVTGIADQALPAERRRSIDRATASPTRSTGNASASILWRWTIPDTGASRLRCHAEAWERSNPSRPRPTATGEAEPRSQVGGIPWCARRTLPANIRKRLFLGRVRRAHHLRGALAERWG